MSAVGTPVIAKGRARAKTAKIEMPLPLSPSTHHHRLTVSKIHHFENNSHTLNTKQGLNNGISRESGAMFQQYRSVLTDTGVGGGEPLLPRSKAFFQHHSKLPHPLPPPPINLNPRILNTVKASSRMFGNKYTDSPVYMEDRWFLRSSKMAKKFPQQAKYVNEYSGTLEATFVEGSTSLVGNGGVAIRNGENDGDLTPDVTRLQENEVKMQLSSESLHMDHAGLKQFPILGPNDRHVRLLSLQHNSISRLQNLVVLSHLIVLDLYCNRIERISGLQSFHCLRVLLLGKNRIRRMEGLEGLRRLEVLDLHGNQLRYLDNLNALDSLRIINVAGNVIRSIRNFGSSGLGSLVELNLKRNRLRSLNGLEKASNLKKLLISNNELLNISSLIVLTKLPFLEEVLLESNPLCSIPNFRNQVLLLLPSLEIFDRVAINDKMRQDAKKWQHQDLAQEEKEAQLQTRLAAVSSRDEVIQQAQRRWESVKDYVKTKVNNDGHWGKGSRAGRRFILETRNPNLPENASESLNNGEDILAVHSQVKAELNDKPQKDARTDSLSTSEFQECKFENLQLIDCKLEVEVGSIPFETSSPKLTKVAIVRPRIRKQDQNLTSDTTVRHAGDVYADHVLVQIPQVTSGFPEFHAIDPKAHELVKSKINREDKFKFPFSDSNIRKQEEVEALQPLQSQVKSTPAEASIICEREHEEWNSPSIPRSSSLSSILPGVVAHEFPGHSESTSSSSVNLPDIKARGVESSQVFKKRNAQVSLRRQLLRSNSVDTQFQDLDGSSANIIPEAPIQVKRRGSASIYRHVVPRRSKQRWQTAKPISSGPQSSPRLSSFIRPLTGIREGDTFPTGNPIKRAKSLSTISNVIRETVRKQGTDYLMEMDGKTLSLYGQGALKQFLTWFPEELAESVDCIKFHFITYDTIIPYFEKLRQIFPSSQHFHFRANNLAILSQLNAMADLLGLCSIHINPEGNPIVENPLWETYAIYRLAHWGLKQINGKEVASDYYGGGFKLNDESKIFECLGYLALSCLPQTVLTPLATKLHTLQTFCCCSQSSSSEDTGRKNADSDNSDTVCNTWDSDPVLLDVIGKEALVYIPPNEAGGISEEIVSAIVEQGSVMLEKLNKLEESMQEVLQRAIQDILIDYICLDNFMKKELKKVKDVCLITNKKV